VLTSGVAHTIAPQRYDVRGPDGARVMEHWRPRNLPVMSAAGQVRSIVHVVEDVTDQVRASALGDELRGLTREAAHERAVVERFFALSLDLMCVASVDGYFKQVCPAFDALGYDRAEWLARPIVDFVHPDDRPAVTAEIARLASGQPLVAFEVRLRAKDGAYRWLAWSCAPDDGTLYAIGRDVTAARATQDALARAKEAAANHSWSRSAARWPTICGRRCAASTGSARRCSRTAPSASTRTASGTWGTCGRRRGRWPSSSTTCCRCRWSRAASCTGEVDLSALAWAAVARLRQGQPARHVEVAIEDGLVAHGDPRLLAVVFDNLLGNAWKFTGKRAAPRVEVGRVEHAGRPAYRVRDNGAGFDMAFAHKLFGVFQRLHAGAEFEGTGVGLATVRRVIGRHGGQVWGEGAVDAGASFYFTLGDEAAR
jgi:PAS domain S-box-containing protein